MSDEHATGPRQLAEEQLDAVAQHGPQRPGWPDDEPANVVLVTVGP